MSKGWQGGSTRAWRIVRARVLARDGNVCQLRRDEVCVGTSAPMHVHHIHGKDSGCLGCATDDPGHLQAACAPCNLLEGAPAGPADPPVQPVTNWG